MNKRISIVMPCKNKRQMTEECVASLFECGMDNILEIILIDDHSTEDMKNIFGTDYHLNTGTGVTDAWNYGASLAKGDYICWVNNDLFFTPGWEILLMQELNNEVWVTSPYATNGEELPADWPKGGGRKTNMEGQHVGIPFLGSCFMMEKENWLRVGPIDPRVKIWCGDNYIFESVSQDFGRQCKEVKNSYVHHLCTQTLDKKTVFDITKVDMQQFNRIYGERRWGNQSVYPWMPAMIDLRLKLPMRDLHKMKVLNIGVGDMGSGLAVQLPHLRFDRLEMHDVHIPYLENALHMKWLAREMTYEVKDARSEYDWKKWDLIMIFDVLEHLEKEESIRIVKEIQKAGVKLLVFIPLEKHFRTNSFGVESQDHLSLWTEQDFKDLGMKTEVLKDFHREEGETFDALWAWNY